MHVITSAGKINGFGEVTSISIVCVQDSVRIHPTIVNIAVVAKYVKFNVPTATVHAGRTCHSFPETFVAFVGDSHAIRTSFHPVAVALSSADVEVAADILTSQSGVFRCDLRKALTVDRVTLAIVLVEVARGVAVGSDTSTHSEGSILTRLVSNVETFDILASSFSECRRAIRVTPTVLYVSLA
jgi:hypothetical protein